MSSISTPAYVPTEAYRAMIDEIIAAPADPGPCLRTRLVEILGAAGVWPDYCRPDSPSLHVVVTEDSDRATPVAGVISLAHAKAA